MLSSILFIPSVHLALTVSSLAAGLLWVYTVVSPSRPVPLCDTHPSASTWSAEGTTTAKGNRLSQGDPPPTGQPLASGGLLWAQGSSVPWPQLRTASRATPAPDLPVGPGGLPGGLSCPKWPLFPGGVSAEPPPSLCRKLFRPESISRQALAFSTDSSKPSFCGSQAAT